MMNPHFFLWPAAWVAFWMLGASTAIAKQIETAHRRRPVLRIRTPLLTLHVSTLRIDQHAGQRNSRLYLVDGHDVKGNPEE